MDYELKTATASETEPDPKPSSMQKFLHGLVFSFDLGTASIGYAVRRGSEFLDVDVIICDEETGDLSTRRSLRRQRRTLRSRQYRRNWFAQELATVLGLELHEGTRLPRTAWTKGEKGSWVPAPRFGEGKANTLNDPISLRCRALKGDRLSAEELFTALVHLFKRRAYEPNLPWGSGRDDDEANKESGIVLGAMSELEKEMGQRGTPTLCQLFAARRQELLSDPNATIKRKWARQVLGIKRDWLQNEFEAIVKNQSENFPRLAENRADNQTNADWLLHGDLRKVKGFYVHFKSSGSDGQNPGVLGLKWPRFDNREPGLDRAQPFDEQDRPLHVLKRGKPLFVQAQWEIAIENLRVIEKATGRKVRPDADSLKRLRAIWEDRLSSVAKKKLQEGNFDFKVEVGIKDGKNKKSVLHQWAEEFGSRYELIEGQTELTAQGGKEGRSAYSSPTLRMMLEGGSIEETRNHQPLLIRAGESREDALLRFIAEVRNPTVRHRLRLLNSLIAGLEKAHGKPDLLIVECVRSLGLGREGKKKLIERQRQNAKERQEAYEKLKQERKTGRSGAASRNALVRWRLAKEADGRCPFCQQPITQEELRDGGADVAHIFPKSLFECNELYNLTVAHTRCNRVDMLNRIPREAYAETWPALEKFARDHFKDAKLELFLAETVQKAHELLESKSSISQTAYISRLVRGLCILRNGWENADGRDPSDEKGNLPAQQFAVSKGALTSRLREAWELNELLHPKLPPISDEKWSSMSEEDKEAHKAKVKARFEKNRGDLRHHALDAMVISCTLPWLAHRVVDQREKRTGEAVWWEMDEETRRVRAVHPIYPKRGDFRSIVQDWMERVEVKHHKGHSRNAQAYKTSIFSKRGPDKYLMREKLIDITTKNLRKGRVHPHDLNEYILRLWEKHGQETGNKDSKLTDNFIRRLCFSHFQQWRSLRASLDDASKVKQDIGFPPTVRIPIRSVRLWQGATDFSTAPGPKSIPGWRGGNVYVSRVGNREVRLMPDAHGSGVVPVFVPMWKGDPLVSDFEYRKDAKPVFVIRKGQLLHLKHDLDGQVVAGEYLVMVIAQDKVFLTLAHIHNSEKARTGFGLPGDGYQRLWKDVIEAMGFRFPKDPGKGLSGDEYDDDE